jgi:RNA 2',3'-cyclic 3'-phosphodiesterase
MRLFVAVDTPAEVKRELVRVRDDLRRFRADVRWEPDGKLHCTLKFLGEVAERILPELGDALAAVSAVTPQMEARYAGLGCFPDIRRPKIIWAGIRSGGLAALAESVDMTCAGFGIAREQRPFHPHVTLGRVKSLVSSNDLLSRIESVTFESPTVMIREILLVQSILKPSGSVYSTVRSYPLGSGEAGRNVSENERTSSSR